jgi:hypothetical protein
MKIRWSSLFFGSFLPHFQIKLSTHGSNLTSIFVIMSDVKKYENNKYVLILTIMHLSNMCEL